MKIVSLAACHNRRERTLAALSSLYFQDIPAEVNLENILVDDASTDGTAEAVRYQFPEVEIIVGTGSLFWAGGMRFGWERKILRKHYDYLLVYNDDIILERDAVSNLLTTSMDFLADGGAKEHIIVGAFRSAAHGMTTYSGVTRSSWWHPLRFKQVDPDAAKYLVVDTLCMNAALISRHALEKIGFLSDYFVHAGADYDYGLRLAQAGGKVVLCPGYIGYCEQNYEDDDYINRAPSLLACYRSLSNTKRQPLKQRMRYYAQHGGLLWPALWLLPYITLLFKYISVKVLR